MILWNYENMLPSSRKIMVEENAVIQCTLDKPIWNRLADNFGKYIAAE